MKSTTIFCAILAIALSAQIINAGNDKTISSVEASSTVEDVNEGMYFNSKSVVELASYGVNKDKAFYVIYDDVDAGMHYESVRVTEKTYEQVKKALNENNELSGHLYGMNEYDYKEYELRIEE